MRIGMGVASTTGRVISRAKVASFCYHEVTDDPADSGFQRLGALPYKHTRGAFAEHLAQIGTSPVAPGVISEIDLAKAGRHLLLTFDDGGKSAIYASEELGRRGWRGHFFITTSLTGTRTFLNGSEIRRIRSGGHIIGSHSHTHPNIFREQSREKMLEEWRVSTDRLAQIMGEPCVTAAVPGGHVSRLVLDAAGEAGFGHLFISEPTLSPRRVGDCWVLGRFLVKIATPVARVGELARFEGWGSALMLRRMKDLASHGIPPLYRLYVRRSTRETV